MLIFESPTELVVMHPTEVRRVAIVRDGERPRWRLEVEGVTRPAVTDWSKLSAAVARLRELADIIASAYTDTIRFDTSGEAVPYSPATPEVSPFTDAQHVTEPEALDE